MDLNLSSLASEHAHLTTALDLILAKIIIIIALEVPRKLCGTM